MAILNPVSPPGRDSEKPSRRAWMRRADLAVAVCLATFCCVAAEAPQEHQVKAAFLLNFTKFVDWPPTAFADERSPLTICILGDDPFGPTLDQIVKGEEVNGRSIAVERIRRLPRPQSCQVLFIPKTEKEVRRILSSVGPGVLTVGDGESFLREGGMVAFVVENRRVRFDIRQSAAGTAKLSISSKLLSVARLVQK
jgi:hypothetical protein